MSKLLEVGNITAEATDIFGIMIRGAVHVSETGAPALRIGTLSKVVEFESGGLMKVKKASFAPVGINPKK